MDAYMAYELINNGTRTEKMRLHSTGNLSLGNTTDSGFKFDVTGTGRFSGQVTSTLAAGTSPFSITSDTVNTNLNADLLDGYHASSFEPTVTKGDLTESTSAVLTITGGTDAVIGSGTSIEVLQAGALQDGYLSSTDWNTFDGKENVLTFNYPLSRATDTISLLYDTNDLGVDGSNQLYVVDGGIDHGGLAGLGDDDHTQYLLADGTRQLTGEWEVGAYNIVLSGGGWLGIGAQPLNPLYVYISHRADYAAVIQNLHVDRGSGGLYINIAATRTNALGVIIDSREWFNITSDGIWCPQMATAGFVKNAAITGLLSGGNSIAAADIPITATRVPYGSATNTLTTEAAFYYTAATDTLTAVNVTGTGTATFGGGVFNASGLVVNETGASTGDFRAESDTNAYMLWLDASAEKIYVGTSGVGAGFYAGTLFEAYDDMTTETEKVALSFSCDGAATSSWQACAGGRFVAQSKGATYYGYFGEVLMEQPVSGTASGIGVGHQGGAIASNTDGSVDLIGVQGALSHVAGSISGINKCVEAMIFGTDGTRSEIYGFFSGTSTGVLASAWYLEGSGMFRDKLKFNSYIATSNYKRTSYLEPVNVTTTDASATTIWSFVPPTNCAVGVKVLDVSCYNASYRATYAKAGLFYRTTGNVSQQGSTADWHADIESNAGLNCTLSASGTSVLVQVTGIAGQTINWAGLVEVTIAAV